jgi:hypothetical protein
MLPPSFRHAPGPCLCVAHAKICACYVWNTATTSPPPPPPKNQRTKSISLCLCTALLCLCLGLSLPHLSHPHTLTKNNTLLHPCFSFRPPTSNTSNTHNLRELPRVVFVKKSVLLSKNCFLQHFLTKILLNCTPVVFNQKK